MGGTRVAEQQPASNRGEGRQGLWALACGALLTAVVAATGVLGWATQALEDHALAHARNGVPPVATVVDWGAAPALPEAHARLLQRLSEAGVRQVLYLAPLPTPPAQPAPAAASESAPAADAVAQATAARLATSAGAGADSVGPGLAQSLQRAGTVWLRVDTPNAAGALPLSALQRRAALPDPGAFAVPSPGLRYPDDAWLAASAGAAPWGADPDADGRLRRVPLLWRYDAVGVPSLALVAALGHWHLGVRDVRRTERPAELQLGAVRLPVDAQTRVRPLWGDEAAVVAARAVLDGTADRRALEDKTVVVSAAKPGQPLFPLLLPDGRQVSEAQALAQLVSALRHGALASEPAWGRWATGLGLLLVALALCAWRPLRSLPSWGVACGALTVCLLWTGGQWLAFAHAGWSLPAALAVPWMLATGLLGGAAAEMLRARPARSHGAGRAPDESERMLGLVRQGQGDWRGALQHYQRAPVTPALLDNLLHLALDLERQQQWPHARQVYEFLLRRDRHHREARQRYRRLRARLAEGRHGHTAPDPAPGNASLPSQIGPYRVDAVLGQGAMGAVYRAHDAQIGRPVALKTMALSREFDGEFLEEARSRFLREAKAAGRLQHPGIVTVYGAGEEQGVAYIAMEYLPGSDLAARAVAGHLLPVEQVLALGVDVALALDYAHQHQVVHRDIKPANLRWNPETGQVKVVDFGVARLTDALRTRTGLVLGTPSFMSPEQVQGLRVDGRSDLYALGVTLFQLLTGQLPLRGDSLPQLLQAIVEQPPPDIRTLRPELPSALADLLARALDKTPDARFQTGRAMAEALQAVSGSMPGASRAQQPAAVDYHPQRAPGDDGPADFQETVMEWRPADRDLHSSSSTGAP